MGEAVGAKGVPLYTDARHYTAAGIPTVLYGAGPRSIEEANAHRADERLPLDDLHKATEVVALTLYDLLSARSEEHTSELPSLMRISYAVFCLKKQKESQLKTTR